MASSESSKPDATFAIPQGTFELRRYPIRANDRLRAWDAADEYALRYLHESAPWHARCKASDRGPNVLVVNDSFGALGVALAAHNPTSWSDSLLAHEALLANLSANDLVAQIEILTSVSPPASPVDVVAIKVPKSNAFLEDQLLRLRSSLHPGTLILGAGMVKHIHTSTLEIFERVLGPTRTSLAKKKARLIHTEFDPVLVSADTSPPNDNQPPNDTESSAANSEKSRWPRTWKHEGIVVCNLPGVFSATKLDVGTRFLIDNFPPSLPAGSTDTLEIVDLGCGNGVVGSVFAARHPDALLRFVDESYMAVSSARATFEQAFPGRAAHFDVATRLTDALKPSELVDLVISNPPFHQNQAVTDSVAWEMFNDANRCLAAEGEIWVVGNRHLGYHTKLKRIFGNCAVVASNTKFVVLRASKSNQNSHR